MEWFYKVIETLGVVAFSISGSMIAIRRKTDLFGVILLSIITALGGGLTRDVVFSFSPPSIFSSRDYLLISFLISIIVFLFAKKFSETYLHNETRIEHINDIFDALGLGIFAVMGVKVGIEHGFADNAIISLSCGLITCICGGMLRDVLTNSMPFVLEKRIYALAALGGGAVYYLLFSYGEQINITDELAIIIGVAVTFILRILAMTFKWNMPKAIK